MKLERVFGESFGKGLWLKLWKLKIFFDRRKCLWVINESIFKIFILVYNIVVILGWVGKIFGWSYLGCEGLVILDEKMFGKYGNVKDIVVCCKFLSKYYRL